MSAALAAAASNSDRQASSATAMGGAIGNDREVIGMLTRSWRAVAAGLLLLSLAVSAAPAGAQLVNPFGRGAADMSEEDFALMYQAIVTALDTQKVGAATSWKNDKTGRAGRVVVQRTFTRSDMPCAEISHRFTSGGTRSYVLPFCRVADGSWKLAF
jgi:surface antigen